MKDRNLAITLIKDKLSNKSTLTYKEIGELSNFHEKYILKLKKDILEDKIKYIHGNTNRKPHNAISSKEEKFITDLYSRSSANVKQFSNFYGKRSYSCIYNTLKKHNLIRGAK